MRSTTTPTTLTRNGAVKRNPPNASPTIGATAKASARDRTRIIAGAFLIVVSALIAGLLYANLGDRHPVVAIGRPVAVGQVIRSSDLTQVFVPSVVGVHTMPWSDRSTVLGRTAAVGLLPGSLLNPGQIATVPAINPADAVLGVVVKPGEFPTGLRLGDTVLAIVLPPEAASATGQGHIDPPITATVASIEQLADSAGSWSVSLAVAPGDATPLAIAGARARLTLVLAPR